MYRSNLKSVALGLLVPEIIAIEVLGGGCEPQFGSGMVPFERALVSSYGPFIVTFPLSNYAFQRLPLLCSSTSLFPTPPLVSNLRTSLPKISTCSPRSRWMAFGLRKAKTLG